MESSFDSSGYLEFARAYATLRGDLSVYLNIKNVFHHVLFEEFAELFRDVLQKKIIKYQTSNLNILW